MRPARRGKSATTSATSAPEGDAAPGHLEERFLATLAATCNARAACAEVGMTVASAYNHRQRWRAFATRWDKAADTAYARLEAGLLDPGCNLFSNREPVDPAPLRDMAAAQAIHLPDMHKHQVHGMGKRPGRLGGPPDMEEVRASILRKIEAIERADKTRLAIDGAEWGRRRRAAPGNGEATGP